MHVQTGSQIAGNHIEEEHVIDIDDLVISMTREQRGGQCRLDTQLPVIHKVEEQTRDKDKSSYEPSIISIGPYHNATQALHTMQKMKWGYLSYILELNPAKKLTDYIEAINGVEKQARNCYADEIKMDRDSFVKMLLLDGCFQLLTFNCLEGIALSDKPVIADASQLSSKITGVLENGKDDFCINENMYIKCLLHDILLFENQIPLFVLTSIYEVFTGGTRETSLLVRNVVKSMKEAFDFFPVATSGFDLLKELHHLLHLFHEHLKPSERANQSCANIVRPPPFHQISLRSISKFTRRSKNYLFDYDYNDQPVRETPTSYWRRAIDYHKAGIVLQKRELNGQDSNSLLDIKFRNGTLEISCLTFSQEIAQLFQNLIAFEHACPRFGNYITVYMAFWSQFSGTRDDAALLTEKGIIMRHVSSDAEIADLFRWLGESVEFHPSCGHYLEPLYHLVELQYHNQRSFMRKFLGSITSKVHSWTKSPN